MTEHEFWKGWALLTCARLERWFSNEQEPGTAEIYKRALIERNGEAWLKAVEWWVQRESKFPHIPEVLELVHKFTPTAPKAAGHLRLLEEQPGAPYDLIIRHAIEHGVTIRQAAVSVLEAYCREHPEDHTAAQRLEHSRRGFPILCRGCGVEHAPTDPCRCDPWSQLPEGERMRRMRQQETRRRAYWAGRGAGDVTVEALPDLPVQEATDRVA